jgi:hypothetical protein
MGARRTIANAVIITLLSLTAITFGADWDYLIWIPRTPTADPLYRFINHGNAAYIDRMGRVVIPPILPYSGTNSGGEFHDGLLKIENGVYVDPAGRKVIEHSLYRSSDFSEGLAAAMPTEGSDWGYINTKGEFAITPRFHSSLTDDVWPFSGGLAKVEVAGRFGYIDHAGDFVIDPRFLDADDFREEMARVIVEGPCQYARIPEENPSLEFGIVPPTTQTKEPLPSCKYTFTDKNGMLLSAARYDYALPFGEGLAPVQIGDRWGFIDKTGSMAIAPRFDSAWYFSDGLALVSEKGLFGYIDHSGAYIIKPAFKHSESFADGRAVVGDPESGYFYIDHKGHAIIPGKFALASPFFKGLAHIKFPSKASGSDDMDAGGKFEYIDTRGRKIFNYKVPPKRDE